jgi:cobalt/nickel transport system permease protein
MHMADALISPAVGGAMTLVSAGALAYGIKKIGEDKLLEKKIPLMGVMGAFIFAGQMINFTIPGTGSSGHIGGGVLLAAALGPFPALLVMASVLLIQCLFFADGGLLAYGCNVFNMGFLSSVLAYTLVFKPIVKKSRSRGRIIAASVAAVILGLQGGALAVVLETAVSGVTALPLGAFLLLMQPIHLAIGLVEGLITAAALCYVERLRPELLESAAGNSGLPKTLPLKRVLLSFLVLAAVTAGGLSIFASAYPDGLEWSLERAAGKAAGAAEFEAQGAVHGAAGSAVAATAFMPDYGFPGGGEGSALGTSAAGLIGSLITVVLAGGIGLLVHALRKRPREAD